MNWSGVSEETQMRSEALQVVQEVPLEVPPEEVQEVSHPAPLPNFRYNFF